MDEKVKRQYKRYLVATFAAEAEGMTKLWLRENGYSEEEAEAIYKELLVYRSKLADFISENFRPDALPPVPGNPDQST